MPWEEIEWARSGERALMLPGADQSCTTGRLPHPPSALTVGTTRGISCTYSPPRGAGRRGVEPSGEGGALCHGEAETARDENGDTYALRRGTDALGFGTAAGEELDCYTADGEEDRDDGLPSDMSGSYVTRDGGTTSNFSPKAVLRSTSELMTKEAAGWYWNASS